MAAVDTTSDLRLEIPKLFNNEQEVSELVNQQGMFEEIEVACGNWQQQIANAIEQQLKKTPHVRVQCGRRVDVVVVASWLGD